MEGATNKLDEGTPDAPGQEPAGTLDAPRAAIAEKLSHPARLLRSLYSADWKEETKELLIISWPVVTANFLFFMPVLISLIFAGTKGTETMDAVALALTFVNLTGTSVGMGLTTAYDTLLSQTFGGANKKRVGIILQRGVLIIMLFCFPCWALYLNIEGIMLALGEPPDVSKLGGDYVVIFIFGLPGLILFQIIAKYMQNQNIVRPPMVVAILLNVVNAIYHAIFLIALNMGAAGAALGLGLAYWTADAMLIFYIWFRGLHKDTWGGWSVDSLQEWGTFTKLAIPGLLMMALEFWNYEIGTLLAGRLGKKDLAAQAIMYQFIQLAFMIPFGVSIAASIRIGQHLGDGKPEKAKVAGRLSITFIFFTGTLIIIIYTGFRDLIPRLFTADKDVLKTCSVLFILVGISAFMDSFQGVCSGILRGCGRQRIGAAVNFVGFYIIGLPLGLSLMLKTNLRVAGFWIGTIFGVTFQAVVFNIVVARTNWEVESEQAKERAGVKKREEETDKVIHELRSAPKFFQKEGEAVTIENKEIPVITHTDISNSVASGDVTSDTEVIVETDEEAVTTMKRLPMGKLILRRSLTLLAVILMLVIGLILRFTIKLPKHKEEHSTIRPSTRSSMRPMEFLFHELLDLQ